MRYKDLIVWKKSMELVDKVYDLSISFPEEEKFVLWSQLVRAAISIPSNIAEGSGRTTPKEFVRFLSIARGSLYELSTQLEIAERRGYFALSDDIKSLIDEVAMMLTKMLNRKV